MRTLLVTLLLGTSLLLMALDQPRPAQAGVAACRVVYLDGNANLNGKRGKFRKTLSETISMVPPSNLLAEIQFQPLKAR